MKALRLRVKAVQPSPWAGGWEAPWLTRMLRIRQSVTDGNWPLQSETYACPTTENKKMPLSVDKALLV
jgi:hypothetical protein